MTSGPEKHYTWPRAFMEKLKCPKGKGKGKGKVYPRTDHEDPEGE
jgi:hypothetical protein